MCQQVGEPSPLKVSCGPPAGVLKCHCPRSASTLLQKQMEIRFGSGTSGRAQACARQAAGRPGSTSQHRSQGPSLLGTAPLASPWSFLGCSAVHTLLVLVPLASRGVQPPGEKGGACAGGSVDGNASEAPWARGEVGRETSWPRPCNGAGDAAAVSRQAPKVGFSASSPATGHMSLSARLPPRFEFLPKVHIQKPIGCCKGTAPLLEVISLQVCAFNTECVLEMEKQISKRGAQEAALS